jgi:signal transduction histidine kinase
VPAPRRLICEGAARNLCSELDRRDGGREECCHPVADDGRTNMEDRLDALGGTLHIAYSPGNGTTLRATIPVTAAVEADRR